jgi:hypothetical protein
VPGRRPCTRDAGGLFWPVLLATRDNELGGCQPPPLLIIQLTAGFAHPPRSSLSLGFDDIPDGFKFPAVGKGVMPCLAVWID